MLPISKSTLKKNLKVNSLQHKSKTVKVLDIKAIKANQFRSLSPSSAVSAETINLSTTASRTNSLPRPTSPSPSVVSEKAEAELQDKQEREEEERKRKIQLYVFISRCIAYPFNAKQPTDMTRRQTKITKQQLETIQGRFQFSVKATEKLKLSLLEQCGLR
ncbi:unnamed protein product [Timema podura]|uniref:Uncharacterized protein n=1 Tax=Timema podura TaxID=61482 RepID=A0ABN7NL87_TIMPD|nr:unnamed protein product [Timema podura]